MKSCSRCGYWKSDREYYIDRRKQRSRDGLHHACKECEREAARDRMRSIYWARKVAARPGLFKVA